MIIDSARPSPPHHHAPAAAGRVPAGILSTLEAGGGSTPIERIVLVSLNPFLGDTIARVCFAIGAYRRRYGASVELHVLCPYAHLLRKTRGLWPHVVELSSLFPSQRLIELERLPVEQLSRLTQSSPIVKSFRKVCRDWLRAALGPLLTPHTVVDADLETAPLAVSRMLQDRGARLFIKREQVEVFQTAAWRELRAETARAGAALVLRLGGSVRADTASGSQVKSLADFVERTPRTIYDRINLTLRAILNRAGRQAGGSIAPSTFRQFRRRQAAQALVDARFGSQVKPPLVLFNFNASSYKVGSQLHALTCHELAMRATFAACPEATFVYTSPAGLPPSPGGDRLTAIQNLNVQALRSVVATRRGEGRLVFEAPHHDDDLVTAAIVTADVIVSLDSGFVHLAYALTGALRNTRARANHVINFGLPGWNASGASFWSLGGPTSIGVIDVTTSAGVEAGYVALRRSIAQCLDSRTRLSRSRRSRSTARRRGD